MTDVIIAPRLEDPLSDVEAVINGGYFQVRASRWNSTAGQWVSDAWPAPVPLTGVAVTAKLDASTVPYELYVKYPDGRGGFAERTEFRVVTASGTPLKWEDLELVGGADAPPPIASDFTAELAALQTQLTSLQAQVTAIGTTGGASTLAGVSGISTDGRALIGGTNTYANMRTLLDVVPTATVSAKAPLADPVFTGNPQAPTPTTGDNDTSIATTAFVQNSLAGSGLSFASAALTGNPTAPTPAAGDADTSIATTAFVDTSFAKKASPTLSNVTLTGTVTVPDGALAIADTNGLQTALDNAAAATAAAQTTADAAVATADIGTILSDGLAPYVTTTQLTAVLANVPYLLMYNGSAWPGARPTGAGTRTVMALGAPTAPTWLDTTRDFWVGTVA